MIASIETIRAIRIANAQAMKSNVIQTPSNERREWEGK
jgi:hypothetical protein